MVASKGSRSATLEAEVEVDPADVGEIRVGDPARIKVDAYPFQKHGIVKGKVINISPDTFSRQMATGSAAYYYLARITLEDTRLDHLPAPTRLLPGMTLSGEIVSGKRTVISYFLYPIIRVLDESFRERQKARWADPRGYLPAKRRRFSREPKILSASG